MTRPRSGRFADEPRFQEAWLVRRLGVVVRYGIAYNARHDTGEAPSPGDLAVTQQSREHVSAGQTVFSGISRQ